MWRFTKTDMCTTHFFFASRWHYFRISNLVMVYYYIKILWNLRQKSQFWCCMKKWNFRNILRACQFIYNTNINGSKFLTFSKNIDKCRLEIWTFFLLLSLKSVHQMGPTPEVFFYLSYGSHSISTHYSFPFRLKNYYLAKVTTKVIEPIKFWIFMVYFLLTHILCCNSLSKSCTFRLWTILMIIHLLYC